MIRQMKSCPAHKNLKHLYKDNFAELVPLILNNVYCWFLILVPISSPCGTDSSSAFRLLLFFAVSVVPQSQF